MKSLLALVAIALLGLGAIACGGANKRTGSAPRASSSAATTGGAPATTASGTTPSPGSFKGDEDDDDSPSNYTGNSGKDNDADFDNDYKNENKGYHDKDDNPIVAYGHTASAADRRAITALVKRYYAAATANDGVKACSMIYSTLVEAIPEDYGQAPGPAYLRGAKTCQAVMSLLFKQVHSRLTGAFEVTSVRVSNNQAFALLGSTTMPAGDIAVKRERGTWKINELFGGPLP